MFDAYIFDLDGTLIDIKDIAWFRSIQRKVYEEFGVFLPPDDDLYTSLKLPFEKSNEYLKSLGIKEPLDYWKRLEVEDRLVRKELFIDGTLRAYPDAVKIKELPGEIALVSNTPESVARDELEYVGLLDHFNKIYATRYKEATSKPEPHGIIEVLNQMNVSPDRAIMIGDSELDVIAGKRAGTHTAQLVRPHFHNYERANPDHFLNDIGELLLL